MSDFGKINWEAKLNNQVLENSNSFDFFLNYCGNQLPSYDLFQSCELVLKEKERFQNEFRKGIEVFKQQPFLAAFLAWIKEVALDPSKRLKARMLLEKSLIGIWDKDGHVWTIGHAGSFDHQEVIDAIRCHKEWSLEVREDLVATYMNFMHWLCSISFGFISKIEDQDLLRSQGRVLNYSIFTNFISKLNEKDRLVAKLLYFGGSRTMEEVINLHIEDVDFNKHIIYYKSQPISYPRHVFADIKTLSQDRKEGKIFIGRKSIMGQKSTSLNPATIFKNFKEAAIEIGLGDSFTPKLLVTNL